MILVAGGTGFVGSAIVTELLSRGESVAVLGRDALKIQQRFGPSVEHRVGDVRNTASLARAMGGVDIVIDAVQFPNSPIENKRRGWTFEEVDYQGACNLIEVAKMSGVGRFVYVSGVGAAEDATKHWFRLKWQAEQQLQASGLGWTVVRPTWVFGPGNHSLNRLLGFGRILPFIPTFGDGQQAMQPVFIQDVGRVVVDAALKPEAAGQIFELGGPDVMSMDDVLKRGLEASHKSRPILHAPIAVGKLMGSLMSLLPSPPLPSPPLSADAVDFVSSAAVADTSNLERVLAPKLTSLNDGLATYLGK